MKFKIDTTLNDNECEVLKLDAYEEQTCLFC